MSSSSEFGTSNQETPKHQPDRVNIGNVIRVGIGLSVIVIAAMIGMVIFFHGLDVPPETTLPDYATDPLDIDPPLPRLDPEQPRHLAELRREHQRILTTYEWIDEETGIARIPIDRAMEMLAEELPARDKNE